MSRAITLCFITLIVGSLYLYFNPSWYGDSVWYSIDLKNGNLQLDSGHLLWRPVVYLIWHLVYWMEPFRDPLAVFQVVSSISAVLSLLVLNNICKQLLLGPKSSAITVLIFATSHFQYLYAGSGSSYCTAVLFVLLSFYSALKSARGTYKATVISALWLTAAWSVWAPAALVAPGPILLASIYRDRTTIQNIKSAAYATLLFIALPLLSALTVYLAIVRPILGIEFGQWLLSSSHGIAIELSLINQLRAALGLFQSLLALPGFGYTVKSLILSGGIAGGSLYLITPILLLIGLVILSTVCFFRIARVWSQLPFVQKKFIIATLASFIPVFIFASLWQGSDIERFSPILPLLVILPVLVLGTQTDSSEIKFRFLKCAPTFFAILLATYNTYIILGPYHTERTETITSIGESLLDPNSSEALLVTTGQKIGPHLWGPLHYFYSIRPYSILYDVQTRGLSSWQLRLRAELRDAVDKNLPVFVSAPLYYDRPVSQLKLDPKYPEPKIEEIRKMFTHWQVVEKVELSSLTFLRLELDYTIDQSFLEQPAVR